MLHPSFDAAQYRVTATQRFVCHKVCRFPLFIQFFPASCFSRSFWRRSGMFRLARFTRGGRKVSESSLCICILLHGNIWCYRKWRKFFWYLFFFCYISFVRLQNSSFLWCCCFCIKAFIIATSRKWLFGYNWGLGFFTFTLWRTLCFYSQITNKQTSMKSS